MRIVTLSRKPCRASSTTANVLEHEAGALNIDASRLSYQSEEDKTITVGKGSFSREVGVGAEFPHHKKGWGQWAVDHAGRWPANVVLVHRVSCEQRGTVTVPGYVINRWKGGAKPFGGGAGHDYESTAVSEENVPAWVCSVSCAVGSFDGEGQPSRYFKQVQENNDMSSLPQELTDYLLTMISPPPSCKPVIIAQHDLKGYSWEEHEDSSVHGILTAGNPGPYMEEIDRVLRPGAHLLILSPDEEPTGHTGACAVEDFGYEIRDAIAVLDTPGEFHYVAKASTSERNAGVRPTVNEQGRVVYNFHPTVKPVGVMTALLSDLSTDELVVDAFMGSGTTGVACLRTGHTFVGIDKDAPYLQIADQRLRHWDRATNAWNGAVIESEAEFEEEEAQALEDFFGFGEGST